MDAKELILKIKEDLKYIDKVGLKGDTHHSLFITVDETKYLYNLLTAQPLTDEEWFILFKTFVSNMNYYIATRTPTITELKEWKGALDGIIKRIEKSHSAPQHESEECNCGNCKTMED